MVIVATATAILIPIHHQILVITSLLYWWSLLFVSLIYFIRFYFIHKSHTLNGDLGSSAVQMSGFTGDQASTELESMLRQVELELKILKTSVLEKGLAIKLDGTIGGLEHLASGGGDEYGSISAKRKTAVLENMRERKLKRKASKKTNAILPHGGDDKEDDDGGE